MYYINGYTLGKGNEDWIMDDLNLAWDNLKAGDSVEDTTAHNQSVYTKKYSGKMFESDVNGEISILPYADKGTYVFTYLEYAGDTKYEADYHKILQSITESPETLPNTQIPMKEITFDSMHIDIPESFEKSDSKSDESSIRYKDVFSHIDIDDYDYSGMDENTVRTELLKALGDSSSYNNFPEGDIVEVIDTRSYDTDAGWYLFSRYNVSGTNNGEGNLIVYANETTHKVYSIDLYGSYIASGYINKYHDILQSIKFDQPSSDIKAIADGFEAFMNKYIDFMLAVKNGSSSLTALGEYSELLTEYTDWMTKIDSINTDNLSAQDAAYFTEVYARVMSKLASAGLSN